MYQKDPEVKQLTTCINEIFLNPDVDIESLTDTFSNIHIFTFDNSNIVNAIRFYSDDSNIFRDNNFLYMVLCHYEKLKLSLKITVQENDCVYIYWDMFNPCIINENTKTRIFKNSCGKVVHEKIVSKNVTNYY